MAERLVTLTVTKNRYPVIADKVRPNVATAINNAMANFLIVADATTPVDTGYMRANKAIEGATAGTLAGSVTYRAGYSAFVHNGTVRQAPQPWARNAIRVIAPEWNAEMAAAIAGLEVV